MFVPSSWTSYGSIGFRWYGRTGCLTRSLNMCFRWRTPKTMRKTSCKEKSRLGSPVGGLGRSTRGASVRPSLTTWIPAVTCRWVCSPLADLLGIVLSAWLAGILSYWEKLVKWNSPCLSFLRTLFFLLGSSGVLWIWTPEVEVKIQTLVRKEVFWFRGFQLTTLNKS